MIVKVVVDWDTDGESLEDCGLTKEVVLDNVPDDLSEDDRDDWISEELSDRSGFCHNGFVVIE